MCLYHNDVCLFFTEKCAKMCFHICNSSHLTEVAMLEGQFCSVSYLESDLLEKIS